MLTMSRPATKLPVKTKAELREMLAEAVRNTQPETRPDLKSKKARQRADKD